MNPYIDRTITAVVAGMGAAAAVLATTQHWPPIVAAGIGAFASAFLGHVGASKVVATMRARKMAREIEAVRSTRDAT